MALVLLLVLLTSVPYISSASATPIVAVGGWRQYARAAVFQQHAPPGNSHQLPPGVQLEQEKRRDPGCSKACRAQKGSTPHLWPLDKHDYLLAVAVSLSLLLAGGAGIGGGGILVPLFNHLGSFEIRHGVALAQVTIFGCALAGFVMTARRRRADGRPLIYWDLILVFEPATVLGTLIGGYLHKVFPVWLTAVLLSMFLLYLVSKMLRKALSTFSRESKLIAYITQQRLEAKAQAEQPCQQYTIHEQQEEEADEDEDGQETEDEQLHMPASSVADAETGHAEHAASCLRADPTNASITDDLKQPLLSRQPSPPNSIPHTSQWLDHMSQTAPALVGSLTGPSRRQTATGHTSTTGQQPHAWLSPRAHLTGRHAASFSGRGSTRFTRKGSASHSNRGHASLAGRGSASFSLPRSPSSFTSGVAAVEAAAASSLSWLAGQEGQRARAPPVRVRSSGLTMLFAGDAMESSEPLVSLQRVSPIPDVAHAPVVASGSLRQRGRRRSALYMEADAAAAGQTEPVLQSFWVAAAAAEEEAALTLANDAATAAEVTVRMVNPAATAARGVTEGVVVSVLEHHAQPAPAVLHDCGAVVMAPEPRVSEPDAWMDVEAPSSPPDTAAWHDQGLQPHGLLNGSIKSPVHGRKPAAGTAAVAAAAHMAAAHTPPAAPTAWSEPVPPPSKFAAMLVLSVGVIVSDYLKSTVPCGSVLYWASALSIVPLVIGMTATVRHALLRRATAHTAAAHHAAAHAGAVAEVGPAAVSPLKVAEGDLAWTPASTVLYPFLCVFAGMCAGLFGVGGGLIKTPLLLELGVPADVAAASSATMMLFTTSSASIVYTSLGFMLWDYALALLVLGFCVALIGQAITLSLIRLLGRRSIIIFMMVVLMSVATVLMVQQSVDRLAQLAGHPEAVWRFGHVCDDNGGGI